MTSRRGDSETANKFSSEAFVWIWLPDATEPVVAGRISRAGGGHIFNYGRSYLEREDCIPIYHPELPLRRGAILPEAGLSLAGCLRDAAPDAWGRRVILNHTFGGKGKSLDTGDLDELTYLLESGSDRVGALDFQRSAKEYVPRTGEPASLERLLGAADAVEKGIPLNDLYLALNHGTSIGGARPKAMIQDGDKKLIAKFSSSGDSYPVVKAEYVAMRLAAKVGLEVAAVSLKRAAGKDVLLVERFDRTKSKNGWKRKLLVSALTLFRLDEMMARYASYQDLAEIVRHRLTSPRATLHQLFRRLVFNVLCGNTDDHARNHACFWDGVSLTLTPAYDICPQFRIGTEASQAMLIVDNDRMSTLANCLRAARHFDLDSQSAEEIIGNQVACIRDQWRIVREEAMLSEVDQNLLYQRAFLNPFAFEGIPKRLW